MKNPKLIINNLTTNEDVRQELWVHYLEGAPASSLSNIFKDIEHNYYIDLSIEQTFQELSTGPHWGLLLKHFTDNELGVILLLTAGHDIMSIARYKGIAPVRIRQMISVIRSHRIWEEIWPSKHALQKKKNSA